MDTHMGDSMVNVPDDVRASEAWAALYGPHYASYVKCYDDDGPTYVMTARGGRILQAATLVHQGKAIGEPSRSKTERVSDASISARLDAACIPPWAK